MGNRAQIIITDNNFPNADPVHLYTHWGGREGVEGWLASALDRGYSRHDDAPYLCRIIFEEMIANDPKGTTGFGISTVGAGDSDYDLDVRVGRNGGIVFTPDGEGSFEGYTFDEFIEYVRESA